MPFEMLVSDKSVFLKLSQADIPFFRLRGTNKKREGKWNRNEFLFVCLCMEGTVLLTLSFLTPTVTVFACCILYMIRTVPVTVNFHFLGISRWLAH